MARPSPSDRVSGNVPILPLHPVVRICTFNADQNLWVHPSGLRVKQEQEEEGGDATPVVANKTRGSIFCVCWDRTGQLLCRGSLDGSMSIVSTYYDPSEP